MHAKRLTCILVGPALLLLSVLTLSSTLTTPGAQAVGVSPLDDLLVDFAPG